MTPGARPDEGAEELTLLGVDFSFASLDQRERYGMTPAMAVRVLRDVATIDGLQEAAIVSTCNRTEFYLVGHAEAERVLDRLGCRHVDTPDAHVSTTLRHERGDDAIRHLLRLGCGLESAILGDHFVTRQLKQAVAIASEAGTLGPVLSRGFDLAGRAGRQARAETAIASGEAGLGAAVAAAVAAHGGGDIRIVLLGAGDAARDVARHLVKRGFRNLTICNRTRSRADVLASSLDCRTGDWTTRHDAIRAADVVIAATGATAPVVDAATLDAAQPGLLAIDLGVPRNIAAGPHAVYLSVDDVQGRCADAVARRREAIPSAEVIVETHMERWRAWRRARPLERMLKNVFAESARHRERLARELVAQGWMPTIEGADRFVGEFTGGVLRRHAAELRAWMS